MAKVSVIIPCFNAERWVGEAIESALAQQERNDVETIVIDDGSTDDSAKIIRSFGSKIKAEFTSNHGPSAARNLGTKLARGEFMQYLDADDQLASGKIGLQLQALESSGADIAYGDWQKLVKDKAGGYTRGDIIRRQLKNPETDLLTHFWCLPSAYLFRRSLVEKAGGFKEGVSLIEDVTFILDCVLAGAKFVYCPGIMAYFRVFEKGCSYSTKYPVGFARSCLLNADTMNRWWLGHGGITQERKNALLWAYGCVARLSFITVDMPTFKKAYRSLRNLDNKYNLGMPMRARFMAKIFGYSNTAFIALWYRSLRKRA